jgi:hypothetical protein
MRTAAADSDHFHEIISNYRMRIKCRWLMSDPGQQLGSYGSRRFADIDQHK